MKASLNLCLLFSLISPVVLLMCKNCVTVRGNVCPRANNERCNSNASCKNSIFHSNVLLKMKIVKKSCTPSASCYPGEYSVTTSGDGFINMLVDCCTTDNCNSKSLKFPSEPKEPNGLECEGIKCLGDQTKCISMNVTYVVVPFSKMAGLSTQGCATPLMCDPNKWKENLEFSTIVFRRKSVKCTDPILSPNVSSLA